MNNDVDDRELIEADCWDCCCRPHRHPDQFEGQKFVLDNANVIELVRYNQVGIVTLLIISFIIIAVWSCFSIVPGFSRYDGDPGELNVVSHTGWWLAIDVFVLLIGGLSIFLALSLNNVNQIEIAVHRMSGWMILFVVLLALGIISNIFHGVLSATELSKCTSTLCLNNQPFLITLLAMLGALAFLKGWTMYRVLTYNSNMKYAFGLVEDRDVTVKRNSMTDGLEQVESQITLRPFSSRHGFKTK